MNTQMYTRCLRLCLILVIGLSVLSARLYYLQVVNGDKYSTKAGSPYERTYPLLAKRGTIVDCNGDVIAKSVISKKLIVDKFHMKDATVVVRGLACQELSKTAEWQEWDEKTRGRKILMRGRKLLNNHTVDELVRRHLDYACSEIAPALRITKEDLKELIDIDSKMMELTVAKDVKLDIAAKLKDLITQKRIKGFRFVDSMKRFHNSPELLTHVIGYSSWAGEASDKRIGRSGIEKACEEHLAGIDGFKKEMRDRRGEILPSYKGSVHAPINGDNVQLVVDMGIQAIVDEQLDAAVEEYDPVRATIIVMDPKTGDVLGIASRPHYNLSTKKGIKTGEYNYALQGQYEPGSTFKMVAIAAALNEGVRKINDKVWCHNGHYTNPKPKFSVRDEYGKGYLKVWEIAKKSNNIGTYMLAKQVGYRNFMNYVERFGFGKKSNVGLGAESSGLVRDRNNMVDFSRYSYGYALQVTPLQIANFYCVIANGGKLMQPRVIKKVENYRGETVVEYEPKEIRRVISERAARDCRQALKSVIEKGGTATSADVEGYSEGGKTGTAEIWDNKVKAYSKTRKTVSFAGMLPIEDPEFVCVVVVQEPRAKKDYNLGGGTVAAPIWNKVMTQVAAYRNLTPTEEVKATLSKTP